MPRLYPCIYYWSSGLYVDLSESVVLEIDKDGKIEISQDGEYHGPSMYHFFLDVCELMGYLELWKEVYGPTGSAQFEKCPGCAKGQLDMVRHRCSWCGYETAVRDVIERVAETGWVDRETVVKAKKLVGR